MENRNTGKIVLIVGLLALAAGIYIFTNRPAPVAVPASEAVELPMVCLACKHEFKLLATDYAEQAKNAPTNQPAEMPKRGTRFNQPRKIELLTCPQCSAAEAVLAEIDPASGSSYPKWNKDGTPGVPPKSSGR